MSQRISEVPSQGVRCLYCLVIVLSALCPSTELPSLSAVAVQALSVISNKDFVSLVPNWGFKDPFFSVMMKEGLH